MSPDAKTTWRQRLALVALGVLLAVILLETVAQVVHLAPIPPPDSYYTLSAYTGTLPKPYERFFHQELDVANWVSFNYRSLRDIDHAYAPPPGVQRILFLGDSYTAGWEVPLEQTYVGRLRAWLDGGYELINAGFYGWGTDRQYLFYKYEGYKYQSDLVVFQVYVGNDVIDNGIGVLGLPIDVRRPYFLLDESGDLVYVDYSAPKPAPFCPETLDPFNALKRFLRERSFTYHLVRDSIKWLLDALRFREAAPSPPRPVLDADEMPKDYELFAPVYSADWETAWAITYALVRALRAEVEAHGGRLVVIIVPTEQQELPAKWQELAETYNLGQDWNPHKATERFTAFFETEGIPYLDLLPAARDYIAVTGHGLRYPVPHWTAEGHCVAAAAVQRWLVEEALIPGGDMPPDPVEVCAD